MNHWKHSGCFVITLGNSPVVLMNKMPILGAEQNILRY